MSGQYSIPWRPAYEAWAAGAWMGGMIAYPLAASMSGLPTAPAYYMLGVGSILGGRRAYQAFRNWKHKHALLGNGLGFVSAEALRKHVEQDPLNLWLGRGFDWKPIHTQRVHDIKKIDPANFRAPYFIGMLIDAVEEKTPAQINAVGEQWIHGVEPDEGGILVPISNLEGHTVIFGTTGCGKTRLLDVKIRQAIYRGDVVIIVDPKGDKELEDGARKAAISMGREFVRLHLAFANASVRYDTMKNFNRYTELSSRVASLVPSETGSDAFTAFAWNALNSMAVAMLEVGEKPSLIRFRTYVETGISSLLIRCFETFFMKQSPAEWKSTSQRYIRQCMKDPAKPAREVDVINGYTLYYKSEFLANGVKSEAINGLMTIHEHDAAHFGKMIANLIPILSMLTSGDLESLLSPDYDDIEDERPIWDIEKIVASGAVAYFGLDSLSDVTVSSAVGSLILADAASHAGAIYNFRPENERRKIAMFVDEAAEVVNQPFIQILNKGRGAGFICTVATQTFPDFSTKLGSVDKARQVLGNFNNMIAMRTKDRSTQDFITETFGESYVTSISSAKGTAANTEDTVAQFKGTYSESSKETMVDMFPPDLLGKLPNWQYVASVSGGRIIKGRLPIIQN